MRHTPAIADNLDGLLQSWKRDFAIEFGEHSLGLFPNVLRLELRWRHRQSQSCCCPATAGDGDELVRSVRKATLEVRLEWSAARADVPRAVGELTSQQIGDATLVGCIVACQAAGLVQCDESGTGG